MAEAIELKGWARARSGKGGARAERREGRVPGIVYGDQQEPESISVDYRTIHQQLHTGHFQSTIYVLDVEGKKTRVIPRTVQLDPVRDFPIHVDFLRLGKDALVTVDVPVRFLNEGASPGLKRGGVLNIVRHEIPVRCPADAIPDHFEIDLTGLEIGDSVHISAVKLPEGVRPTITDRDFTVATIVGRAAEEPVPGAEAAEAAEPGAEAAAAAAPAEGAEEKEKPKEEKEKKK
ncbi:MAG TPA: 50S ribosomal protein L25/general stress protein Ctc [Methyloceanibacter sp.]|nr:50S ribosomal protein L25/general stress protein Ctc [Methyloceanibacter sp.]